jgi:hypothetical protein
MAAPTPALLAAALLLAILALPSGLRLAGRRRSSAAVSATDEVAALVMTGGMIVMLTPLGERGLVMWCALFGGAGLWLAVSWARDRLAGPRCCATPRSCGHHAISSLVMVHMAVLMAGHGPHAGHGGGEALSFAPALTAVALGYLVLDIAVCGFRIGRGPATAAPAPRWEGALARNVPRAGMSAAMAGMLLAMV